MPTPGGRSELPAAVLVSFLAVREEPRQEAIRRLSPVLGPLEFLSAPIPFPSDYYQPEMGGPLTRRVGMYRRLAETHRLAAIKRACLVVEAQLSRQGRRRVNLDPGLLTAEGLVLATTKPRGHRIALAPGLWAELTLWYHQGAFQPLPWTYPDWAGEELTGLLTRLRRRYLWRRKEGE